MENLGTAVLPHKISEHGLVHKDGVYMSIDFDLAPTKISELKEEFGRDIDIIRRHIFKTNDLNSEECTLCDELLPPAYRKDVKQMIEIAKKKKSYQFQYNSGLKYYPFQK